MLRVRCDISPWQSHNGFARGLGSTGRLWDGEHHRSPCWQKPCPRWWPWLGDPCQTGTNTAERWLVLGEAGKSPRALLGHPSLRQRRGHCSQRYCTCQERVCPGPWSSAKRRISKGLFFEVVFFIFPSLAPGFWAQGQPEPTWSKPSKKGRTTKAT